MKLKYMKFKIYLVMLNQSSSYFWGDNNWEGAQREASRVLVIFYILIWVGITECVYFV